MLVQSPPVSGLLGGGMANMLKQHVDRCSDSMRCASRGGGRLLSQCLERIGQRTGRGLPRSGCDGPADPCQSHGNQS